jgi:hypothetical protein
LNSGIIAAQSTQGAVLISGNQTISGVKTFATGIFAPNLVYNTGNQTISGVKTFATGIVAPNLVYNTGSQTISGVKTFANSGIFNSGIDLQGSKLVNFTQDIINVNSNFLISGNSNSDFILANSANQITGTIVSGNVIGFSASIFQIGAGKIQITGSGSNVRINSLTNSFRTSGPYARFSILHTGNNGYIIHGDLIA